jgi:hypothetical protein
MQSNARPSLKVCLDNLTNDDSPPLKRDLRVEYIILRRVSIRKDYVYVEFVDGDVKDEKEWFEGPVPEYMTIRALFEMRGEMDRGARREVYGRRKLRDDEDSGLFTGNECEYAEREKSLDGNDMVAVYAVESGSANGVSSEGTDKYVSCESSSAAPRSSAGTRRRTSREMSANVAETRPDARESIVGEIDEKGAKTEADEHMSKDEKVDFPNPKFPKMETKSAAMIGNHGRHAME